MAFPSFIAVLSSTKRIINSNASHFLYLAFLFLFPVSVYLLISPILSLYFTALAFLLFLLSVGTITYSTFEVIHGRQISVSGSIKSLSISFFPLLGTALLVIPVICFGIFTFFRIIGLGFGSNIFIAGLQGVILFVVIYITMGLQVYSSLAYVTVVVESKWGFESLQRSKYLLQEMRSTGFALLLLFGILIGPPIWVGCITTHLTFTNLSKHLDLIPGILGQSLFVTMYMVYCFASTTVLYMYCKSQHGELPSEIAKDFTGEYVSLPVDGMERPHDASMAEP